MGVPPSYGAVNGILAVGPDVVTVVVVGAFGAVGGGTNVIPAPNVTPPPVTCIVMYSLYKSIYL
jgi:hypothetical protein